ncbi:hypothetical protein ACKWTF_006544 [Chironomus riparius]
MNRNISELIKFINKIDEIFTIINKAFGVQIFFFVMQLMLMGISTMFMLAHKITSSEDIFDEDSPIEAYLICLLHLHLKIAQISFMSYKADQKVSGVQPFQQEGCLYTNR